MLQSLPRLERSIRDSRNTDKTLVNWWLYILLLAPVTLGIMVLVVWFQRLDRRDKHVARIRSVLRDALECTKEVADNTTDSQVAAQLTDIEQRLSQAENSVLRNRGAALWFILSIVTFGLAAFYPLYYLTRDFYELQRFEQDILDEFSKVWVKIGVTKYPITIEVTAQDRNFWLYLFLTLITFGIWGLYWDYVIHTEPERVFKETTRWEEPLLACFRQI